MENCGPLHRQIDAAADGGNAGGFGGAHQAVAEPAADWTRHRHMGDEAAVEKALLARKGAVDELVDENESSGSERLAQRADGADRDRFAAAGAFEGVDIGAVVYPRGRQAVAGAVTPQEYERLAVENAVQQPIRRRAPRGVHRFPTPILKAGEVVDPAAANDADGAFRHASGARYSRASSSTSKTSVEPGGIIPRSRSP